MNDHTRWRDFEREHEIPDTRPNPRRTLSRIAFFLGGVVLFLMGLAMMAFTVVIEEADPLWPVLNGVGAFIAIILAATALHWSFDK